MDGEPWTVPVEVVGKGAVRVGGVFGENITLPEAGHHVAEVRVRPRGADDDAWVAYEVRFDVAEAAIIP
jgi:hypothetical protein